MVLCVRDKLGLLVLIVVEAAQSVEQLHERALRRVHGVGGALFGNKRTGDRPSWHGGGTARLRRRFLATFLLVDPNTIGGCFYSFVNVLSSDFLSSLDAMRQTPATGLCG